jgi:phytoene/squalene synthetase
MVNSEDTTKNPTGLALYLRAAERSSSEVIRTYSTSFGLASKLLSAPIRRHVENIYALVRVADEIVDGSAAQAKAEGGAADPARALDDLEREVYRAISDRFSANLVVHAFAHTANATGFDREIIRPFFDSMRMDLWKNKHDQRSFEKYVYGSAEVVGLMCLQAFVLGRDFSNEAKAQMTKGARALGSAFQKVNFLRDLSADARGLGRSYFPGVSPESFTEADKVRIVDDIRGELAISASSIRLLPKTARRAVVAAHLLFEALNERIGKTSAQNLISTRISVPTMTKAVILIKAWFGVVPK